MKFARLVLSNFKRHKTRTALTIFSIVVAFILFAYLSAIRNAFNMGVSIAGQNRLVVRNRITLIQPLPQSYEAQLEQIDGVADATELAWFGGIYKENESPFPQMAVEPEGFLQMYPEYLITPDAKAKWLSTKTGAIAGRKIAERYGWKVGDKIPIKATYMTAKGGQRLWTFDLVGILDGANPETDTSSFYFRHDYMDENRERGKGLTGWYMIRVKDPRNAEAIARKVDERFANSPYETKTETEKAFVKGFAEQMGNIGAIVMSILTAVFFTILLVAGNTMAQAVRERTGELGVLKAIGFTDAQTLGMVIAESLLIAGIGGTLGLLLGWLAVHGGDPTGGALPIFYFPPRAIISGIVFIILLGLITGAMPAIQAMRLNAVEALRRE
ncbi:MAG TPA: FtsX-like permease family protein [Thermoanaerobaculia bacterium]|nr:FtsX-like permease family protein [Thermoanaerobaculia bacterium]